jgi:hypothetical protein
MFVTPHSKTAMINPYHKYKPNYKSGRHRSAGKDASMFDICMAAKMVSYRKTHSLIDAFMKSGDPEQQRHTLLQILTHKRIIEDTKHVLQHVELDKQEDIVEYIQVCQHRQNHQSAMCMGQCSVGMFIQR